ncbi:LOW QUALITY PROTEIN: isocitrate dehydrogenase [NAD] subunit beta, mitochondrial-like [Corticium candelabrum]|uniref:LOW QUALITY PROTEIN: isocitrate dehydrogenase [NAD] subunit beta, mitochondrial-like n=1 Tax=Corticium candelabrum TaxID=121492 RepID=UPI002E255D0B|nr:LOW QUALITY PROTEIN: isocitrate dehydrogenase [NAD] subunit beta, mitochondrial-like [Corticium candelabrum]
MPFLNHKIGNANVPVDFEELVISGAITTDSGVIDQAVSSIKRNRVALKGVLSTPLDGPADSRSLNVQMRVNLDLFASVVQCKTLPGLDTRHGNIDIAVIRENTEGEYSGLEHESIDGVVESLKIITREKSHRIAKFAFDYAMQNNRKKVTAIHKANIMKQADGMFLECCTQVAELYPKIKFESMIVDNTCMQLVANPQQFDVMVMPNLYGNIVSNVCAGLVGGAGVVPGMNIGDQYAVFEQGARHKAIELAGRNKANPTGIILSAVAMLNHLKLGEHASAISIALKKVIADQKILTSDLGGSAGTGEFVQAIVKELHDIAIAEKACRYCQ